MLFICIHIARAEEEGTTSRTRFAYIFRSPASSATWPLFPLHEQSNLNEGLYVQCLLTIHILLLNDPEAGRGTTIFSLFKAFKKAERLFTHKQLKWVNDIDRTLSVQRRYCAEDWADHPLVQEDGIHPPERHSKSVFPRSLRCGGRHSLALGVTTNDLV